MSATKKKNVLLLFIHICVVFTASDGTRNINYLRGAKNLFRDKLCTINCHKTGFDHNQPHFASFLLPFDH
jgi:hypothetical protein